MKTYLASLKVFAFLLLAFLANVSQAQQNLPATHLHFNDDTSKLQFAIVSDLWGGYCPGVFDDAVDKLNLLQPQFVMSVGDLIDGKTYDSTVLDNQWDEFNVLVNSLSMPFFYVPGNHDISNPWMEIEWQKRLGRLYYYFIQKNVLFLCIDTQDGGSSGIHAEQIAYFKKAIKDHPAVRWTFVFMHRPVWKGQGNEQGGYENIEAALSGRNYTLFSGHNHTYLKLEKNGNNHYVLGSTGGGCNLIGEKFGKFNHITWVTVNKKESPKIVNLKLDGIIKEDVVNKNTYPITSTLIMQNWMTIPRHVSPNQFMTSLTPTIIFNNPTNYPLKISGDLSNMVNHTTQPQEINLVIPPKGNKQQMITIESADESKIDLAELPFIEIELLGSYIYEGIVYEIPARKKIFPDWKHLLPKVPDAEEMMSAQFEHLDNTESITVNTPEYLHNKWYWSGPEDCLLRFNMAHDKKYLYLVATVNDDQLVMNGKRERDIIYVNFEDKNGEASRFTIYPDSPESTINTDDQTKLRTEDIRLTSAVEKEGLIKIMLRVPIAKIARKDNSFRFNIGYRDQDNSPDQRNSTLYWKPLWDSETDYQYSGTFIMNNQH